MSIGSQEGSDAGKLCMASWSMRFSIRFGKSRLLMLVTWKKSSHIQYLGPPFISQQKGKKEVQLPQVLGTYCTYSPWANEPLNPILQGEVAFLSGLGCGESWLKEAGFPEFFRRHRRGFQFFFWGKNEVGVCDPLEVCFSWTFSERLRKGRRWFFQPFYNHGSVENDPKWKETSIGDTPIFHRTMTMRGGVTTAMKGIHHPLSSLITFCGFNRSIFELSACITFSFWKHLFINGCFIWMIFFNCYMKKWLDITQTSKVPNIFLGLAVFLWWKNARCLQSYCCTPWSLERDLRWFHDFLEGAENPQKLTAGNLKMMVSQSRNLIFQGNPPHFQVLALSFAEV